MSSNSSAPSLLRRLGTPSATKLAELAETFDELQTVLRCCERLIAELERSSGEPDEIVIEAGWTLALLCYARSFSSGAQLTGSDLTATQPDSNVLTWHGVLLELRERQAGTTSNPRETFSVGVAQDADGAASAVGISSVRRPDVDEFTVRQTGAIAYALCALLDERISAQQEIVFSEAKELSAAQLNALTELEVVAPKDALN